ncbi:MAG: beta-galactosidase [Armatimonadetes bacterium]|nr:beta-galactosidase [Armatimonadota bacterium]
MNLRAMLFVVFAGLTQAMLPADDLGPDLVTNGSFERGDGKLDVWHWGSSDGEKQTLAIDDAVAHSGRRSVRLHSELPLKPHVYGGISQVISGLAPGSQYVLRLWVKGRGVGTCWFGGGPEWASRRTLPSGDFDWTQVELRWTAPETASQYELRVNVDSETEALWVDDVSFQEVDPLGLKPRVRPLTPGAAARAGYLLLPRMEQPLEIDGNLADWPADAPETRMPADAGVVMINRRGDDDLSASLRAVTDAKHLYLSVAVRDDLHWAPPEAVAWTNDGLQVAFDPRHEKTPSGYGPHDSEYSLVLGNDGVARVQCWQAAQGLGDQSKAIRLAVRREGAVTVYEVAFLWRAIGVTVGAGGPVLGLNVLVNDNDGSGRRGYIELTQGIGKIKDPASYVTAMSSGARSVAVLPAGTVAYVDEPLDLKVVVVPGAAFEKNATVEIAAVDKRGRETTLTSAELAAETSGMVQLHSRLPAGALPVSTVMLRARVSDAAGVIAQGTAPVTVSDLKARLVKDAARLRDRTAQVAELAAQAETKGIATDYERVAIATAQDFVDYALDDITHGRPARAEHVLAVLDQALTEAERALKAYLSGTARPLLVPRFVTSPVEAKDGAFWADTVIPSTGKRERRPVFFTGYGHFSSAVRDLPKFTHLGANIIQIECGPNSTQPAENVVTDEPVRNFIGRALNTAAQNNVMICWLASPHYFPGWALQKWPELQKGDGGFFGLAVDAPQAREIFRTHLHTSLNAIKDSPALHSVCLSNEPTFTNWQQDPFRRYAFTEYLRVKFGSIGALNEAWGSHCESFDAVPVLETGSLPREEEMTPLRYEMARFNMRQFSEYHRFMADVVHATRPGTWAHAKVMCVPVDRQHLTWGCDPEQFAWMGDLNGNDCSCMFAGFGDQYAGHWLGQNVYYDLQRSMRQVPVINTEDHIILDREQRLIPPVHTDFALWQGAIHGRGASMIWVWERTYDRTSDFEGSILHRPENVMAVGKVGLDLQRLAPEVVRLQRAKAPIAILYSMTSLLWSDESHGAMLRAYEALNACGVPVRFVSEGQAVQGRLKSFRAVIAPSVKYAPDSVAQAVADYCASGGKLWVIGDAPVCGRGEYGRPRSLSLPESALQRFPGEASARDLWAMFLAEMESECISRPVTVTGCDGQAPWAVEYRSARDNEGVLVSIVNLWGKPKAVRLSVGSRAVKEIHDLRNDRVLEGDTLVLEPLDAMLLRVK